MADIGDEVPLQLRGAAHLPGHGVEIPGQRAQLVIRLGRDAHLVIAACHLPRGAGNGRDGFCEPAAEYISTRNTDDEQHGGNDGHLRTDDVGGLAHTLQVCGEDERILVVDVAAHHHLPGAGGAFQTGQDAGVRQSKVQVSQYEGRGPQVDGCGAVPLRL